MKKLLLLFLFFQTSLFAFSANYTSSYNDGTKGYNIVLAPGTYSFKISHVPTHYHVKAYRGTSLVGQGDASYLSSPSFDINISKACKVALYVYDKDWKEKMHVNWYITMKNSPPTTPGTPSATNITRNSVYVYWSSSSDPDGDPITYEISWAKSSWGASWTTKSTTSTHYSISGLSEGTTYKVNVRAKDSHGATSNWTSKTSFTTKKNSPPSTPGTPKATNITKTSAYISWNSSSDPDRDPITYEISWAKNKTFATWTTKSTTSTHYSISGLSEGTSYLVNVRAKDSHGATSNWTSKTSFTTKKNSPPSTPGTPKATNITRTSAYINWYSSSDPDGDPITYEISWAKSSWGASWTTKSTTSTHYSISGLSEGTTYKVNVRAKDSHGATSNWTSKTSFTTKKNSPPSTPGTPKATNITETSAYISWNSSSDPDRDPITYEISWAKNKTFATWTTKSTTSTHYSISGLSEETSYLVNVRAKDSHGSTSNWTSKTSFTTKKAYPDLVITTANATPTTVYSGDKISVSCTIKNQGDGKADFSWTQTDGLKYYLSDNSTYSSDDKLLKTVNLNDFAAQESRAVSDENITIPSGTTSGDYYIIIYVDPTNHITESDENNNTRFIKITVHKRQPDLIITSASAKPTTAQAGDKISVSCTIKNQGDGKADFSWTQTDGLKYYLSDNSTYSSDDKLLKTVNLNDFAAQESRAVRDESITIPSGTTSGDYYIIIYVDPTNHIQESKENNNTRYIKITVHQPLPDLAVQTADVGNGKREFWAGDAIDWNCSVKNIGDAKAKIVPFKIYFSTDEKFDASDISLINTNILIKDPNPLGGKLDPQETWSISSKKIGIPKIEIPKSAKENTDYYILFVADPDKTGTEKNWDNNIKSIKINISTNEGTNLINGSASTKDDGTLDVKVNASGYQGDDLKVYAYYQASSKNWRKRETELTKGNDGYYTGTMPNQSGWFYRKSFDDGEIIKYKFVAKKDKKVIATLPSDGTYFTATAVNGSMEEGLSVINAGVNMFSTNIITTKDTKKGIIHNTVTFSNKHSLYMACSAKLNGKTIDLHKVKYNSNELMAEAAGGFDNNHVFIAGNLIHPSLLSWELLNIGTLTFNDVVTTAGSHDIFELDINRTNWIAYTLDVTQSFFNILDAVAKKTIKADSNFYQRYIISQNDSLSFKESSEINKLNGYAKIYGKAYIKTLMTAMKKDMKSSPEWKSLLDEIYGIASGNKHKNHVFMLMMEYIANKSLSPKFIEDFCINVADELGDNAGSEIAKTIIEKLAGIAYAYKIAKASIAISNVLWKVTDIYYLPPSDKIFLQNKQLQQSEDTVISPVDKASEEYPEYMQDIVKTWKICKAGNQTQFVVTVKNTGKANLSNVWVGLDIYAPPTIDKDGNVIPGKKVENTYTPIADNGPGGTGKRGKIKFSAYLNGNKITSTFVDEKGDDNPNNDEKYGQGVNIAPGQTVEFRAPYTMIQSVTGHNYHPGIYTIRFASWVNGYPGSPDGVLLSHVEKLNLMVIDNKKPVGPLAATTPDKPFDLVGSSDGTNAVLMWTGVDPSTNPDVVYYRIQRKEAQSGTYKTIALVDRNQFNYADVNNLTPGSSYTYRLTAVDNGGNESDYDETTIQIIDKTLPTTPTILSPSNGDKISSLSPEIKWTTEKNANKYQIQVSTDNEFKSTIIDSETSETSKTITGLANNTQYFLRVRSLNDTKTSGWSDIVSFTTENYNPVLNVDPKIIDIGYEAGQTSFSVSNGGTGTMKWIVSIESKIDWIHFLNGNSGVNTGTVNLQVDMNPGAERTGELLVKIDDNSNGDNYVIVKVTQAANPVPKLSWTGENGYSEDGIEPNAGDISTSFHFKVRYMSYLNNGPLDGYPKLHILRSGEEIDGSPFTMQPVDNSPSYSKGANYEYDLKLPEANDYSYYFEAQDIDGNTAEGEPTNAHNGPVVQGNSGNMLSGHLTYANSSQTPLGNVSVSLVSPDNQVLNTTTTDNTGLYTFTGLADGDYTLKPDVQLPWGGVSAMDVTLYKKMIIQTLSTTPFIKQSGDVDNSSSLSTMDLTFIKQRIIQKITTFTSGDWLYNPTSVTISGNNVEKDVQALCYGDANGSYVVNTSGNKSEYAETFHTVLMEDETIAPYLDKGELILPFILNRPVDELSSVTMVIKYPYEFLKVAKIEMSASNKDLLYNVSGGTIRLVFSTLNSLNLNTGDTLLRIRMRLRNNLSNNAITNETLTFSGMGEFGDYNGNVLNDIKLHYPEIDIFRLKGEMENQISVYPNPARTRITVTGVEGAKVQVFDTYGNCVYTANSDTYKLSVDLHSFTPGTYTFRIIKGDQLINKKFVVLSH